MIPLLILAVPYIKNKLVSLSQDKGFSIISLPISAYLIYDISIESNVFGLIGLLAAYIVFFSTYAAPTQSLLQKWLREKHGIEIEIHGFYTTANIEYSCDFYNDYESKMNQIHGIITEDYIPERFDTFEQALEKGLIESLKLIK